MADGDRRTDAAMVDAYECYHRVRDDLYRRHRARNPFMIVDTWEMVASRTLRVDKRTMVIGVASLDEFSAPPIEPMRGVLLRSWTVQAPTSTMNAPPVERTAPNRFRAMLVVEWRVSWMRWLGAMMLRALRRILVMAFWLALIALAVYAAIEWRRRGQQPTTTVLSQSPAGHATATLAPSTANPPNIRLDIVDVGACAAGMDGECAQRRI